MGLATIDPHSQKEHTEIHKILKFSVIRLVLTEIQPFKNAKLHRNILVIIFYEKRYCISLLCRYGFRGTPLLFVSARPKLGDRQVKLTHVTEWIEKKLKQEFRVSNNFNFNSEIKQVETSAYDPSKWPCSLQVHLTG